MTIQLTLTRDADEINLQANGYVLKDGFFPETPTDPDKTITDKFELLISGTSEADLQAKIRAVGALLEWARTHPTGPNGVFLNFAISETLSTWRTRLTGGVLMFDAHLDHYWRSRKANIGVAVEHQPFWEGPEAQIPLTNDNGSANTSGLPVFNCSDGTGSAPNKLVNWADISGSDVTGDIPGATRLEVTNTYVDRQLFALWIGQNWTNPTSAPYLIEAEDSSTGTEQLSSAYSGGKSKYYDLPQNVETDMFTWTLTAGQMSAWKGSYYKFLARFVFGYSLAIQFRLKIYWNLIKIYETGRISLEPNTAYAIRDLFTLRLPPWLPGHADLDSITLKLAGYQNAYATSRFTLDCLQIMPTDGWRFLRLAGYGCAQNSRFIDDGINQESYLDNGAGSGKIGILTGYGNAIQLAPGKAQRLYFLMHSWIADIAEIDRSISVKLFYRPRRRVF